MIALHQNVANCQITLTVFTQRWRIFPHITLTTTEISLSGLQILYTVTRQCVCFILGAAPNVWDVCLGLRDSSVFVSGRKLCSCLTLLHHHMVRWVVGSILHGVNPLIYFSFQPVLHDWCNKGRGMCYPVCGMVHIKEPLLLIGKSSLCGMVLNHIQIARGNPLLSH